MRLIIIALSSLPLNHRQKNTECRFMLLQSSSIMKQTSSLVFVAFWDLYPQDTQEDVLFGQFIAATGEARS
ncbi:MAG: hypothetical protein ACI90V_002284 [Bacillariaceae sp.]|jgi:hypothetical protein